MWQILDFLLCSYFCISAQASASNLLNSSPDLANTKEKTPMCLVNELARYNKVLRITKCEIHYSLGNSPVRKDPSVFLMHWKFFTCDFCNYIRKLLQFLDKLELTFSYLSRIHFVHMAPDD